MLTVIVLNIFYSNRFVDVSLIVITVVYVYSFYPRQPIIRDVYVNLSGSAPKYAVQHTTHTFNGIKQLLNFWFDASHSQTLVWWIKTNCMPRLFHGTIAWILSPIQSETKFVCHVFPWWLSKNGAIFEWYLSHKWETFASNPHIA